MERNFQGAILGPEQAHQQRNEQPGFFSFSNMGVIIIIVCIIGLIWYFSKTYAKKDDLDKVISIVKLLEEEITLIKKSQEEYKKQTVIESKKLNTNNTVPQHHALLQNTVSQIDEVNKTFDTLSDKEKQENITNYTQQLKNLVTDYNTKLADLTEATKQALAEKNSLIESTFDPESYKVQFDDLLTEYNNKLKTVAHGDLDKVLGQFKADIEDLKKKSSKTPGSTVMVESDKKSFTQQEISLSEEHKLALDKLNNLNISNYTSELDNLKKSYGDELNALNLLHNTAKSVSAELQGLDIEYYKKQYQELIDTYTKNLTDLHTQYVNILDIKEKRDVDLNAIVTAFENANKYLEDQKKYFNDEIQRLVSRAEVIAESTPSASTTTTTSTGVSSAQITGLQTLIDANESAISELRKTLQTGLTQSDLKTSSNRLNDLITANTNAINKMIEDSSNYGNKTTIKSTTDSLNTLIKNNSDAIQELKNIASSASDNSATNQTSLNSSITNLQTLIDDNKKEISTLKTNSALLIKQSDLNDAITSLQSVVNTNADLINGLKADQVKKLNYDDTINTINTLINTNKHAIKALENTNASTDLSGYINQTALDTAVGNLRKIVKGNEDAIKVLQSDTATALKTVDFQNLEEIFITQQLHVGDKFQPNAGIMNLYAAAGGGVDAGATIKFLNAAGREYFYITSVVDNPGQATEKSYFKITNGGLKVDKEAVFQGNVQIKKKLDVPRVKISKSSYVNEDGALVEKSGHMQLQSSNNGSGGWIEFVDETVKNNTWFYMQGTPAGLYISKNAAIQGSLMVATVESTPARVIFKDAGGNTNTYVELQTGTGGANHALFTPQDFKVGKNTKISGNLEVDGSITLKDGNGKAIKADFIELKNDLKVGGHANVYGNTTLHGTLDAKTKLTAHTQAEFKDGVLSQGVSLFKGKTSHPSYIKMSQENGHNSHLSFLDSNEKELSKLLATEQGLSVETGELSVKGKTKTVGGIDIGTPGKADGWGPSISMYGAGHPAIIDFRSNKKVDGKYERQGTIRGVGGLGGGIAIRDGPLDVYKSLNVREGTVLVGNTKASNLIATGNIESQDLKAKRNLFVIQNSVLDGSLKVKGAVAFNSNLNVTGHSKLNTLELTGSILDIGHKGVATKESGYAPGRININSSHDTFGKLVFRNKDRTDTASMTISGGKIRFTGRDAHFDENISTAKNITASGGHITGNYITSTNNFKTDGEIIQKNQVVDTHRNYDITLATKDYTTDKFYPIILNKDRIGKHGGIPIISFQLLSKGMGGGEPFNDNTLIGHIRGGGWSDKKTVADVYIRKFDEKEHLYLGIYNGTKDFVGTVIYVRGGINYSISTNATQVSISPKAGGVTMNKGANESVFPIKNKDSADIDGKSKNINEIVRLYNKPSGRYVKGDINATGNYYGQNANLSGALNVTGNIINYNGYVHIGRRDKPTDNGDHTRGRLYMNSSSNKFASIYFTDANRATKSEITYAGNGADGKTSVGNKLNVKNSGLYVKDSIEAGVNIIGREGKFSKFIKTPQVQVGTGTKHITVDANGFKMNSGVAITGNLSTNNGVFYTNGDKITIKHNTGYIDWRNKDNKRQGWIMGKSTSENSGLKTSGHFLVQGDLETSGNITGKKSVKIGPDGYELKKSSSNEWLESKQKFLAPRIYSNGEVRGKTVKVDDLELKKHSGGWLQSSTRFYSPNEIKSAKTVTADGGLVTKAKVTAKDIDASGWITANGNLKTKTGDLYIGDSARVKDNNPQIMFKGTTSNGKAKEVAKIGITEVHTNNYEDTIMSLGVLGDKKDGKGTKGIMRTGLQIKGDDTRANVHVLGKLYTKDIIESDKWIKSKQDIHSQGHIKSDKYIKAPQGVSGFSRWKMDITDKNTHWKGRDAGDDSIYISEHNNEGSWRGWRYCPHGSYVCGMEAKDDGDQISTLKMRCCSFRDLGKGKF